MAIKAYQIENRKIPTTLNELVPNYISKIPEDSFNGKPIRFSTEKKVIYSIGEDLKDDGGEKEDIALKIEF
jgi:hypothetical protein